MKVRILHNTSRDEQGRPVGIVDGYQPGHTLTEVFAYESDHIDPMQAADRAFYLFNVGDDPQFGRPSSIAKRYRAKRLRSLSVGDVVIAGETALACESFGWELLAPPVENVDHA